MSQLLNGAESKKNTRDHRSDQSKTQVVYFLLVDNDRIKIGETGCFPKRLKDHRAPVLGRKSEVQPLCVVRGTLADEKAIQRYFKDISVDESGEIFRIEPELVDYIRWLRSQYYVWTPETDMDEIDRLDNLDPAHWMPSPERRKNPPKREGLYPDPWPLSLPPPEITVDDFYTNERIIEAARATFGGCIDFDPASHSVANRVVKATVFYTLHDDGTSKEWSGNVWLNPPFSEWQLWVPKIIAEWRSGRVSQMCVLAATRTITAQYFVGIHENCKAICVFKGRIPFWGSRATSPDDGHVVFYFGDNPKRFAQCFSKLGYTYQPIAAKAE